MEAAHRSDTGRKSDKPYYLAAEIDPPKGTNLEGFVESALSLRGRVDSIRVTDSEHAIMRMSPLAPCLALKEKGLEPVMVVNGRDRNRISFQGDLLGASALGITDIVIKEGHDPAEGDQPVARTSGDLDLPTMLKCASSLNAGRDLGARSSTVRRRSASGFRSSCPTTPAVTATRSTISAECRSSGCLRSVSGRPTTSISSNSSCRCRGDGDQPLLSVMLLKSVTMIRYLNNLKGVPSIPQEYLKKMMDAPVKQDAGLTIGADFIREIAPIANGIVILAIGWKDRLPDILDLLGR